MYRAVASVALRRSIPIEDEAAITHLAETMLIEILPPTVDDGRQTTVLADGADITWDIRSAAVDRAVSPVSAYPGVRAALTVQQRRIAAGGGVVMAGRDIGTVVLPDAEVKIYVDASPEERARRRHAELRQRGIESSYAQVLRDLQRRDHIDSTREAAPLSVPPDATVIDSTHLTIADVEACAEKTVRAALKASPACVTRQESPSEPVAAREGERHGGVRVSRG